MTQTLLRVAQGVTTIMKELFQDQEDKRATQEENDQGNDLPYGQEGHTDYRQVPMAHDKQDPIYEHEEE